ncbi:LysR substrate-binding domain-containing protein [Roseibium aggregatum]|uniref:LysR family transcriptional regulator n=1 Tax=Roseibium aggregatum TaxID=187304 RepID=A0A939J7C8_9HYPH|nr:LysR substrate-binding domain-containing protein [Roseibium aggregatum]MBN9673694.1 LysR family transcriptional regulator [Roseibium aggregatum]
MRRLPPLKALHAFEAAARHESVTKAADELNVSHSAISQQIKLLEHYFNQKLFRKKGNGLELMPKARNYLQDIKQSLDLIAVASENLSSSGVLNRVRVNATPTFTTQWLIPRTADFQRAFPRIEVRIETSTTDELRMEAENNDLIIRRYSMKQSGMECVRILDDETIAVISPGLLSGNHIEEPADLLNYNLLHIRSRISAWPNWFKKAGIEASRTLKGQVFDHILMSIAAARNGAGICLTPRIFVEEELRDNRLVNLCPDITVVGSGFYALYDGQNRSIRNIEKLIDWLTRRSPDSRPNDADIEWELYS